MRMYYIQNNEKYQKWLHSYSFFKGCWVPFNIHEEILHSVCSYSLSKPQSDRVAFPHISSILYNSFQLWLMWPKLGINVRVDLHVLEGWLGRISGGCNDKPCISVMCFHPGLWIASKPITEKHRWCRWNPAVTGDKSKCDIIWFLFTFCGQLHPYTKVLTVCFIKAK